jgi:hypothetical protein
MIQKILQYLLEYFMAIPKLVRNWILVRIFRSHLKHDFVKSSNSSESNKFAIIAVFPGTSTLGSLERQISLFIAHKYNVIVIVNKNLKSKEWLKELTNLDCTIIQRNNLGADFGAYKLGVSLIKQKHRDSVSEIIFANDSMFYTPNSTVKLKEFLKEPSKFNCLFFHKQSARHAGSMLLKCDSSIIKQEIFWKFWKEYFPYVLKKQIVRKGEHQLSKMIGLEYFQPLVSLDVLVNNGISFEPSEIFQVLTWSKRSNVYIYDQIQLAYKVHDYSRILEICIMNLQISNSLGLWISKNLELPFKLDLPQFALCTISDLLNIAKLQDCKNEEIQELRELLESRANITEGSLISRVLL